jgi:hypothetical protein
MGVGGLAVMLTAASWVLQRLPGQMIEGQRAELIRTLRQSQELIVVVRCGTEAGVSDLRPTAQAVGQAEEDAADERSLLLPGTCDWPERCATWCESAMVSSVWPARRW